MKIVQLNPHASRNAEVVEEAKRILELAESGVLVDLTWCGSCADGATKSSYTATLDAPRRLAAVSILLHRLHMSAVENTIEG